MFDLFTGQIVETPERILVKYPTQTVCLNHRSMTKCTPKKLCKLAST